MITFKEYIEELQKLYAKFPDVQLAVYDNERDCHTSVEYLPVEGFFDTKTDEFIERSNKVNLIVLN